MLQRALYVRVENSLRWINWFRTGWIYSKNYNKYGCLLAELAHLHGVLLPADQSSWRLWAALQWEHHSRLHRFHPRSHHDCSLCAPCQSDAGWIQMSVKPTTNVHPMPCKFNNYIIHQSMYLQLVCKQLNSLIRMYVHRYAAVVRHPVCCGADCSIQPGLQSSIPLAEHHRTIT